MKTTLGNVASSPLLGVVLLAVGWGPQVVADLVWRTSPALAESYAPQGFAMAWLGITFVCSLTAVVVFVVHITLGIVRYFSRKGQ